MGAWRNTSYRPQNSFQQFLSQRYYSGNFGQTSVGTNSPTSGAMTAHPFFVESSTNFDLVSINVTAFAATGGFAELGIYGASGVLPSTLLQDFGQVDVGTNGIKSISISLTLPRGLYWLAMYTVFDTTSCTLSGTGGAGTFAPLGESSSLTAVNQKTIVTDTGSVPLPATFPSTAHQTYGNLFGFIRLRVA